MPRSLIWFHLSALLLLGSAAAQVQAPAAALAAEAAPVSLPFEVPTQSTVLIAQPLSKGVRVVAGTSAIDGQPIPDPVVGASGTLYWTVSVPRGVLTFEVEGGLVTQFAAIATLTQDRQLRPVSGTINAADWLGATALPTDKENAGAIKLPLDGSEYATVDRVTIVVEGPLGQAPVPLVNGVPAPAEQVGKTVTDSGRGVQRLEYFGIPLRVGVNTISLGTDQITVRLAGPTQRVEIEPLQLVADGSTPLRLRVRALDAAGTKTAQSSVTLRSNLEPATPDALPGEAGYQLALRGGEGILELRPQSTPTTLSLDFLQGDKVVSHTYEVRPNAQAVGVGMLSATLGLDGAASRFSVQARAYYETPLAGGKLYIAADKDGLPTTTNSLPTNTRFTNYGDRSVETIPLQGIDPVALTYDHPRFTVSYRHAALPITVLPVSESLTALTVQSKSNPSVSGFVAWVPKDRVTDQRLTPEGTRLLRLGRGDIVQGSQQLVVVTLDRISGTELSRKALLEGPDYTIDPTTGIVTLTRALDAVDGDLNTVYVSASYRILNSMSQRQLAYGAQIEHQSALGGGALRVGAGVTQLDGTTTFGVAGSYRASQWEGAARAMYAGGVLATANVTGRTDAQSGQFNVRYQTPDYRGLGAGAAGLSANGRYEVKLNKTFGVRLEGEYGYTDSARGYAGALVTYRQDPWTVGVGGRYGFGSQSGFGLTGSVGYKRDPLAVEITHTQPLGGSLKPVTEFKTSYQLTRQVTLDVKDTYTWGEGNVGAVTLNTQLGNTNYIAAYETGSAAGSDNRARFGVSTTLPLNDRLGLGLRASYLRHLTSGTNEWTAGADLNYRGDNYQATIGTDLSAKPEGLLSVVRGGISGDLTQHLSMGLDTTAEFGVRTGGKLGLGYAYHRHALSSLGYARLSTGSLSGGNANLSAGVAAEYAQTSYAVRGGLDLRMLLDQPDTLTYQPTFGIGLHLSDTLRLGAWGRALVQPASSTTLLGYGVEAGIRALPGTWFTAGYNIKGFNGLGDLYTKQGAYVRLDLTLDETLNGANK